MFEKKEKKKRGCLLQIILVIAVVCVGVLVISQNSNISSSNKGSVLSKELSLTEDQETTMKEVFEKCGIGEITSVSKFQSGEGHTSYHMEDKETEFYSGVSGAIVVWVNNSSKEVETIYYNDNDIYSNGEVISSITNFYVNEVDRDEYRTKTQEAIKQILNRPDTAKFRGISAWNFELNNGIVIATSTVEAKNALGEEIKETFQAKFDNKRLISLVVGGTEYIK